MKVKQLLLIFLSFVLFGCSQDEAPDIKKYYEGDLIIESQAQLDTFEAEGYTGVYGGIYILDTDVSDLSPLNTLKYIGYELQVINNEKLTSLKGLEGIKKMHSLYIVGNQNLQSIHSLQNLTKVDGRLEISDNSRLTTLTGLEQVDTVTYDIWNMDMPSLTNLTPLKGITRAKGLLIKNNSNLENLDGFTNLRRLEDQYPMQSSVWVLGNEKLTSITGLKNFSTSSGGSLFIVENPKLRTLEGLNNIQLADYVEIGYNHALEDISALQNLRQTNRGVSIFYNLGLRNMCGLAPLLQHDATQKVEIKLNAYNPTPEEILAGKCSN